MNTKIFHVVFTRYELNGKPDFLRWEDGNNFLNEVAAARHANDMIKIWADETPGEIIGWQIVRTA